MRLLHRIASEQSSESAILLTRLKGDVQVWLCCYPAWDIPDNIMHCGRCDDHLLDFVWPLWGAAKPGPVTQKPVEHARLSSSMVWTLQVLHGYLESAKQSMEEEIHTGSRSDKAILPAVQQAVQHQPEALHQQLLDLRGKVQELRQQNTQVTGL
jgi:hypothetical protein